MGGKTKTYDDPNPYGLFEWLRMHRIGLGPFYLAFPVLIMGVLANVAVETMLLAICMVSWTLGAVAWVATRVPEGWRRRHWGAILLSINAWIVWAATLSTANGWMWALGLLVSGTTLLAIPHWMDQVKRTKVNMEGLIRDWPVRGKRIGIGDTNLTRVDHTAVGWRGRLAWLPGMHNIKAIEKIESEIEGALGLPHNSLRVERDGKSTNSVILQVVLEDPHAKGIMWTPPVEPTEEGPRLKTLHGGDPFKIGVRADGTEKFLQIFKSGWGARQLLIGGTKGSGKSGLLNLIWTIMSLCDDVVQWGIDLKGGAELGPWEGVFDWIVNDYESALRMIEAAEALVERRGQLLKKYGWKSWKGSPEHPWLLISIDEAASLLGKMDSKQLFRVEEIARKGRAVGVAMAIATQFPTVDAIGSTQVREQLDQAFCFRMKSGAGEGFVLTAGDVKAEEIDADRPGTCYHQDGDKLDRIAMRIIFVGDGSNGTRNTVKQIAEVMRGETPLLDEDTIRDGIEKLEAYANRREVTEMRDENETAEGDAQVAGTETGETENETVPEFVEDGSATLDDIMAAGYADMSPEQQAEFDARRAEQKAAVEAEPERLSDEDARAALLDALREAGPAGLDYKQLCERTTRKSTWVYDRLAEHDKSGVVRRTNQGSWVLAEAVAAAN